MNYAQFLTSFFSSDPINTLWQNIFGFITNTRGVQIFFSLLLVGFALYIIRRIFGGD